MNTTRRVWPIEDLAEYLKILKSTLLKLSQEGKLVGQKVSQHSRFHQGAVDAWLKNNDDGSATAGMG